MSTHQIAIAQVEAQINALEAQMESERVEIRRAKFRLAQIRPKLDAAAKRLQDAAHKWSDTNAEYGGAKALLAEAMCQHDTTYAKIQSCRRSIESVSDHAALNPEASK